MSSQSWASRGGLSFRYAHTQEIDVQQSRESVGTVLGGKGRSAEVVGQGWHKVQSEWVVKDRPPRGPGPRGSTWEETALREFRGQGLSREELGCSIPGKRKSIPAWALLVYRSRC